MRRRVRHSVPFQWSKRECGSKDFVSIVNSVADACHNSAAKRPDPVNKVMLKVVGKFEFFANTKDVPASSQHRVHGRTSCREQLDQRTDRCRSKRLLDNVVESSEVELPVDCVNALASRTNDKDREESDRFRLNNLQ